MIGKFFLMKKKESKSAIVITCDCLSITNNEITKTARWREIKIQLCKWHCLRHTEEAWEKRMGSSKESWAMSAITCSTALWNHKEYFLKKGVARARARSFRFFDHSEEYEKKDRERGHLGYGSASGYVLLWCGLWGHSIAFFSLSNFHIWFCKHKVY